MQTDATRTCELLVGLRDVTLPLFDAVTSKWGMPPKCRYTGAEWAHRISELTARRLRPIDGSVVRRNPLRGCITVLYRQAS